ncbi:hypothetical protein NADFUDRAFT_51094 [Nadsonia fulvescens var. elongata DSM 6958]|uniref:Breast carcinoma amplified sequence 2 n=1 Tax=Nadsonia fulvescens var. elongata DSM 6958 TaxID=857566 RepID=A0A1E3PLW1_9ASCO|nr:hypothetical protein NADFUDRAFT_51094 [Nadsonia fulvescens var. elongata DSM 6958]
MALTEGFFDSLPYIDITPTEDEVLTAEAVILSQLIADSPEYKSVLHHSLSKQTKENQSFLTPALEEEFERIENGELKMNGGIDLSKYSQLEMPDETSGKKKINLKRAYVALCHTQNRQDNLELLLEYGKNQWLIGNDNLAHTVQVIDQEIDTVTREIDYLNRERKRQQVEKDGGFKYMESRWKESLRNVLDVNIACVQLSGEIDQMQGVSRS